MSKKFFVFASLFSSFFSLAYLIEPIRLFIFKESGQSVSTDIIYLFIVTFLIFLVFIYSCFSIFIKNFNFKEILIFSIFINLVFLFILPITSNDLYSYIYQSRVWTVFKASPYLFSYSQFSQDIYYEILANGWSHRSSPYGPLLLLIKSFFTYLFSFNIWLNIYLIKLFFIIINIINGYLVYKISKSSLAFYLYAFNPLIIWEIAVNGHNDVIFLFFILLSIYYFFKEKTTGKLLSYLFLCFSFFSKYISFIFFPIFIIYHLSLEKNWKNRLKLFFYYSFIFIILALIFYYPFISSIWEIFLPLVDQAALKTIFLSPLILLLFGAFSIYDQFDLVYLNIAIDIARFLFFLYFIYIIYIFKKAKNDDFILIKTYNYILLGFFLCFFSFLLPWYLISLMAVSLLLLKNETYKRPALLIFYSSTAYGIMQYILLR